MNVMWLIPSTVISHLAISRLFCAANEPVGKVLLASEKDVFGGHLTLPRHEIIDRRAFHEVSSFCISPKNLLGDFFYSLNDLRLSGRGFLRIRCTVSATLKGFQEQGQYAWQFAPTSSARSLHDHEMQKHNQASQAELERGGKSQVAV
jgi:hypothetical protein